MPRPTLRRNCELAVVLAALALAGAARGAVVLETYKEHQTMLPPGQGADVLAALPFHLEAPGGFYAKLLVTPWNAVNNGTANGTVLDDHTAGSSGWWVTFLLADGDGAPLTRDAAGRPVDPALGSYVDSTPTPVVALAADAPHQLLVRFHVPPEAAWAGAHHRVALALVYRGEPGPGGPSGGSFEPSRAYTEHIRVSGTPAAPSPPGGPPSPPPPGGAAPGAAEAPPQEGTGSGLLVAAALGILVALVALVAAVLLVLREVALLRRHVEGAWPLPGPAPREPGDGERSPPSAPRDDDLPPGPGAGKEDPGTGSGPPAGAPPGNLQGPPRPPRPR